MVGEEVIKESKNAKRKAKRLERLRENRKIHRKVKKDIAKQKKKESRNPDAEHVSKKVAKFEAIERLKQVQLDVDGVHMKICIDLQFEHLMNDKELTHLARQLGRVYGQNKNSSKPCNLTLSNLNPDSKTHQICCDKNDGFANYILKQSKDSILELFDPKSIVYLTPDSDQILDELSKDKIYVIGGLVDDSVKKNSSLSFAGEHQLQRPSCQ